MANNDIGDWYRSIPQVTRYWFSGSVLLPLLGKIGIFQPHLMILHWEWFAYKFEIWRPITSVLYYPITPGTGFHYLINLYFLYSYSTRLESGAFAGKPGDYLFMLIFNWLALVVIGFMCNLFLLMDPMIISVLYVWCQLNKDAIVQFWFGTQFKAMYLPWILAAFNIVVQGGGMAELLGIVVGHLYYFFAVTYPQDHGGRQWLKTPAFIYRWFPNSSSGVHGFGVPPSSRRNVPPRDTTRFPGRGHPLGGGD